ncbi:MAG: hypothetical protein MJZ00_07215 [Paludibacteraceae bacterium]|nr:hypothetical protein [Paludibacteraceae bacterium]
MKDLNSTIEQAAKHLEIAIEKINSLNVTKNNKMIKELVLTHLGMLAEDFATISEKAATRVNTKAEERKGLIELSKTLKERAENAGFKMSVNQMLQSFYLDMGATRMATQDSWEAKGGVVVDGAKKYLFWAAPKTLYKRDGSKYQFSEVQYRYDIKDVNFVEDDLTESERLDMVQ